MNELDRAWDINGQVDDILNDLVRRTYGSCDVEELLVHIVYDEQTERFTYFDKQTINGSILHFRLQLKHTLALLDELELLVNK